MHAQPIPDGMIQYGRRSIPYHLTVSDRATVEISVHPDATVHVRAPHDRSEEAVRRLVQRRARWIARQQDAFRALGRSTPRLFVSGATHRYLGRQYRLRVHDALSRAAESVKLRGRFFQVTAGGREPERVKVLLGDWYRAHAQAKFAQRMAVCAARVRRHGIAAPPWQLRRMRTRWGSCTPSGRILLNPELIRAPLPCVDYVILHELCHLKHAHHGPAFYRMLTTVLPEWRRVKERLENKPY